LYFDLEFPYSPQWSADIDLHFVDTPRQSFSFSTTAIQFRYLLLDDIVGDLVSLAIGGNIRVVSDRSLKDISCPFNGNASFVANFAMGKEITHFENWCLRLWLYGEAGIANIGSPWIEGKFGLEGNHDERHKWSLIIDYVHGYGRKRHININHFRGYGRIRHKSLDIDFSYGYQFGVWGTLFAGYKRRVIAKTCPSNVNTFYVYYCVPFSF
jgi:hypothetical protein